MSTEFYLTIFCIVLAAGMISFFNRKQINNLYSNNESEFEMPEELEKIRTELIEARATWAANTSTLTEGFNDLSKSFYKWEAALSNTGEQGALAEEGLQVMLENAGLVEGASFDKQITEVLVDGNLRPDFYVYGADGSALVIDSKAPLKKYEEAVNTDDEEIKKQKLRENAQNMLNYAANLGANDYTQAIGRPTPDIVIMYVPYIGVYLSALEIFPDLHKRAWAHRVQICPPETLYPILKNFMLSWQQKKLHENAEEIQKQTKQIHIRIKKFQDHFIKVGKNLTTAAKSYNQAVSSWDARLMPSLRKLESMGIAEGSRAVDEMSEVDQPIRELLQNDDEDAE